MQHWKDALDARHHPGSTSARYAVEHAVYAELHPRRTANSPPAGTDRRGSQIFWDVSYLGDEVRHEVDRISPPDGRVGKAVKTV